MTNGYVAAMRKGFGEDKLNNVLTAFPDLNRDWLLFGEGEMLKSNSQAVGDVSNSTLTGVNINGNGININPDAYNSLLRIVEEYQSSIKKFQEQTDRLIALLEAKYGTKNG